MLQAQPRNWVSVAKNRVYLVTAYVPTSNQNGRFRTIGVVADSDVNASRTAATALLMEVHDPALSNLLEIVTVTGLPEQTTVHDLSGNAYVLTVVLAPVGGNISA